MTDPCQLTLICSAESEALHLPRSGPDLKRSASASANPTRSKSSRNGSERFWPTPRNCSAMAAKITPEAIAKSAGMFPNLETVVARDFIPTSLHSMEPNTQALTSSQADFLVSLSAWPGSDLARQMTVRSGRKCSELLTRQDPIGCLVKTLLESSRWNSTMCFLTWKASATPRGRLLFRLAPSMPDTDETEFGLWRTPNAAHSDRGAQNGRERLAQGHAMSLQDQVKMWPTPQANDDRDRGNAKSGAVLRRAESGKQVMLSQAVSPVSGALNPQWVEWLMGYPIGHTACEAWAMPLSRKSRLKFSPQSKAK